MPEASDRRLAAILFTDVVGYSELMAAEEERGPAEPLGCQQGLQSRIRRPQGLLADGEFWACEPPRAGAGQARFIEYEGIPFMVTGGSSRFLLHWDGAESIQGRMMITGVTGEEGYYAVDIPSDDDPLQLL